MINAALFDTSKYVGMMRDMLKDHRTGCTAFDMESVSFLNGASNCQVGVSPPFMVILYHKTAYRHGASDSPVPANKKRAPSCRTGSNSLHTSLCHVLVLRCCKHPPDQRALNADAKRASWSPSGKSVRLPYVRYAVLIYASSCQMKLFSTSGAYNVPYPQKL